MIRVILLAAVAFCLTEASGYGGYGNGGYVHGASHNGYESDVNRVNAQRQLRVNEIANWVGSGSGTARRDGVPGTPLGVTGHDRYSYGHGRGYGGYGHGGYGGYGHGGVNYGRDGHNYGHGGYGAGYSHGGYGGFGTGYGYGH